MECGNLERNASPAFLISLDGVFERSSLTLTNAGIPILSTVSSFQVFLQ